MSSTTESRLADRAWRKRMVRSGVTWLRYRRRGTKSSPARIERLTSSSSIECLDRPAWVIVDTLWSGGRKPAPLPSGIERDTYVSDFARGPVLVSGDAQAWRNGEANCQAVTR